MNVIAKSGQQINQSEISYNFVDLVKETTEYRKNSNFSKVINLNLYNSSIAADIQKLIMQNDTTAYKIIDPKIILNGFSYPIYFYPQKTAKGLANLFCKEINSELTRNRPSKKDIGKGNLETDMVHINDMRSNKEAAIDFQSYSIGEVKPESNDLAIGEILCSEE
jgi:hypothetical protein